MIRAVAMIRDRAQRDEDAGADGHGAHAPGADESCDLGRVQHRSLLTGQPYRAAHPLSVPARSGPESTERTDVWLV